MPTIARVVGVPLAGAYYQDELAARTADPIPAGERTIHAGGDGLTAGVLLAFSGDEGHGSAITWGDCIPTVAGAEGGMHLIREAASPALEGRALDGFRPLLGILDAALDAHEPRADGLSRRDVIGSPARVLQTLHAALDPAAGDQWAAERRIARLAVRSGVTGALLHAAALARGVPMADVLAAEWSLPLPAERVPVTASGDFDAAPPRGRLIAIHAYGDLVAGVRRLAAGLAASGEPPTIYLMAGGAPGLAVDNHPARLVGKLYALEHAAAPCPLIVEDPALAGARDEQIALMRALRRSIRARGMRTRLAADGWVGGEDDAAAFAGAGAADIIHLGPAQIGGVDRAVEAALACRRAEVDTVLDAGFAGADAAARAAVHAALAVRPLALVAGDAAQLPLIQNEMARALDRRGQAHHSAASAG